MKGRPVLAALLLGTALTAALAQAPVPPPATPAAPPSDQDIVDAYHYMLGRWLVLRRETLDLKGKFRWNEIVHRASGEVASARPNLDVAISEAWIYVDESSCTLVELPEITGRYYTMQLLNGWGEVIDNINERRNPKHPNGAFAFCLSGTKRVFPPEVRRQDYPNRKSHLVIRIELGSDPAAAVALQKKITLKATGAPKVPKAVVDMQFSDALLPGVEAFDKTEAILASEPDLNEGMGVPQAKARAVAKAATDSNERARVDAVIRKQAIPAFFAEIPKLGQVTDGWVRPRLIGTYSNDYLMRSIANYTDLWVNTNREVAAFGAVNLDGSATYTQTFPADALPRHKARYFWSLGALDAAQGQVIANPLGRYVLNPQSRLKYNDDGSLTLAFAPTPPEGFPESNWLPTPAGKPYNLTFRCYGPTRDAMWGPYSPPPLVKK